MERKGFYFTTVEKNEEARDLFCSASNSTIALWHSVRDDTLFETSQLHWNKHTSFFSFIQTLDKWVFQVHGKCSHGFIGKSAFEYRSDTCFKRGVEVVVEGKVGFHALQHHLAQLIEIRTNVVETDVVWTRPQALHHILIETLWQSVKIHKSTAESYNGVKLWAYRSARAYASQKGNSNFVFIWSYEYQWEWRGFVRENIATRISSQDAQPR